MALNTDDILEWLAVKNNWFFYDNFQSTEQIDTAITQTGHIYPNMHGFEIQTGIQQASTARANYARNIFNPLYAKLLMRFYMGSMDNVFAFLGFKRTLTNPTSIMTESHSGLMIENGNLYFSTGNQLGSTPGQQKTLISGIDMQKDYVYKIVNNQLWTQPFPYREEGLHGPYTIPVTRIWTMNQENEVNPPEDVFHYLIFYISNTTNHNQYLYIRKIVYEEDFAD